MLVEPGIEQAPWEEQAQSDASLYLKQIEYLFERSRFYREKLERAGFATHGAVGGLDAIEGVPLTEKDELRRSRSSDEPIGAHRTASREEIVRIYSTSGTTGSQATSAHEPRSSWVRTSARSYAAEANPQRARLDL
jgi:phenylacetate-CoA ligase